MRTGKNKWRNRYYIDIYRLAAQGMQDQEIASALGVPKERFSIWKSKKPTIQYALDNARQGIKEKGSAINSYMDYVYDKLPANLQKLWDQISAFEDEPSAVTKIEKLLEDKGEKARMHLFLQALVTFNFNPSKAMRSVNISRIKLNRWMEQNPEFSELVNEMVEHKKNFAEEALFKLVKKGDTNAVIFVNKTLNKDRGYADKTTVEHTGEIKHSHEHRHLIDLDKLNLPLAVRKAILIAVREQRDTTALEGVAVPRINGHVEEETEDEE